MNLTWILMIITKKRTEIESTRRLILLASNSNNGEKDEALLSRALMYQHIRTYSLQVGQLLRKREVQTPSILIFKPPIFRMMNKNKDLCKQRLSHLAVRNSINHKKINPRIKKHYNKQKLFCKQQATPSVRNSLRLLIWLSQLFCAQ